LFYEKARARDGKMAGNLIKAIDSRQSLVVLVTGGFHAAGIDRQLEEAGMAVIPVVPGRLSKNFNPKSHLRALDNLMTLSPPIWTAGIIRTLKIYNALA
jgi:pheromone shutdown protein TraB